MATAFDRFLRRLLKAEAAMVLKGLPRQLEMVEHDHVKSPETNQGILKMHNFYSSVVDYGIIRA